jgi:very-short-patch-repair endonuclease
MTIRTPHPNARTLRKKMPSAEKRLWFFIRRKQLGGFRFRRQHTIGPYIADFVCIETKLVVELDGEQHGYDRERARDCRRDECMEAQGFHVTRNWNHDVYNNINDVLEAILNAAENAVRARDVLKDETP